MANIYPDISKWQKPVDDTFNRDFLMFRALDEYGSRDLNVIANLNWAINARRAGKIVNFGVYVIPGFATNATLLAGLADMNLPTDCVVMVDWETWSGKLSGDHSAQNNDLVNNLRIRQNGRGDLVWGYGNRGDLSTGWSGRPAWLGVIVASYNSNNPQDDTAGCIGWQYTNGTTNLTSWPSSTPPEGACDHNALFVNYPKTSAPQGVLMALSDAEQAELLGDVRDLHTALLGPVAVGTTDQASELKSILEADRLTFNNVNAALAQLRALPTADAIAAAVVKALPTQPAAGGLTKDDVVAAVKSVFAATGQ